MFKKDKLYSSTLSHSIDFSFDEKVAQIFPDMVHRSIPGYTSLLTVMQAIFADCFNTNKPSLVYDLGCSVGGVTLALSQVLPESTNFIGVDLSAEMLVQYEKATTKAQLAPRTKIIRQDINGLVLQSCDAISLNFTLQFLEPDQRQAIITRCYRALKPSGILFIAEKTRASNDVINWHEQFKRNNGYSELEIAQKRGAIENVMKIDDEKNILARFQLAGFKTSEQVFHALSFKAWVAQKSC